MALIAMRAQRDPLRDVASDLLISRFPLRSKVSKKNGGLTRAQFERLADIPPEEEWLVNITNAKTRRAYRNDVHESEH